MKEGQHTLFVVMHLGQSTHGSCVFLIRSSSACAGEFVLSFFSNGKYLHYNITYTNDYKYCFENGPHFAGMASDVCAALSLYVGIDFRIKFHVNKFIMCYKQFWQFLLFCCVIVCF